MRVSRDPTPNGDHADVGSDPSATDEFLERIESLRDYLTAVARQKIRPEWAAKLSPSDMVQETLIVASRKAEDFRSIEDTPARLGGWLRSILHFRINAARRHWKAVKRDTQRETHDVEIIDQASTPSRRAQRVEEHDALASALESLPEHYRNVLIHRYWERMSYESIGTRLGISTEAARKLGGRALILLRSKVVSADERS